MADIPTSCRAALLTGHGQPLEIAEVPIPQELEPGALLVRNTAATICASDVHLWEGDSGSSSDRFPRILGHEMTGRVARISEGAEHDSLGEPLHVGDRIIWTHGFCGQCVKLRDRARADALRAPTRLHAGPRDGVPVPHRRLRRVRLRLPQFSDA